jgi:hypothetical protein
MRATTLEGRFPTDNRRNLLTQLYVVLRVYNGIYSLFNGLQPKAGPSDSQEGRSMPHIILLGSALVWLVATSMHVAAQEPGEVAGAPQVNAVRVTPQDGLPLLGVRSDALGTIRGYALTAAHSPLPRAILRLRNAAAGTIVGTQMTDLAGTFTFLSVDPGTYVIELYSDDQRTVLAASEVLNINSGQAISAVVQLPLRAVSAGMGLARLASSAGIVMTTAAASGLLTRIGAGTATCEPLNP